MKSQPPFSQEFVTLNSLFNVNVGLGDEVDKMLAPLPTEKRKLLQREYRICLDQGRLGAAEFRRFTACTARDELSARSFFDAVYRYAFEDGDEPEVADYWDR